jgi:hypothetical protein
MCKMYRSKPQHHYRNLVVRTLMNHDLNIRPPLRGDMVLAYAASFTAAIRRAWRLMEHKIPLNPTAQRGE